MLLHGDGLLPARYGAPPLRQNSDPQRVRRRVIQIAQPQNPLARARPKNNGDCSTFAHYNKFKGDDGDDKLFAKGDKNWLHGANGRDKVTVVGSHAAGAAGVVEAAARRWRAGVCAGAGVDGAASS